MGDEWRPIKTAPKEGWFWLWLDWRGACIGRRSLDPGYHWEFIEHTKIGPGYEPFYVNAVRSEATKWMPLPEAPAGGNVNG